MAEKLNINNYNFKDLVLELFNQKVAELHNQFGSYIDFEMSINSTKQITADIEKDMLLKIDRLPVTKDSFYPFRECKFDIIPAFSRKEFIATFCWYKNQFTKSIPTAESMAHAKELVDVHFVPETDKDKAIVNILHDGTFWADYVTDYDLDWIFVAAKSEYGNTEFSDYYDNAGWVRRDVVVADYLYRHEELVIILEELKSLRQRIRDTFMLGNNSYVGF